MVSSSSLSNFVKPKEAKNISIGIAKVLSLPVKNTPLGEPSSFLRFSVDVSKDLGPSSSGKTVTAGSINCLLGRSNIRANVTVYKSASVSPSGLVDCLKEISFIPEGQEEEVYAGDKALIEDALENRPDVLLPGDQGIKPRKGHGFVYRGNYHRRELYIDVPMKTLEALSSTTGGSSSKGGRGMSEAELDKIAPKSSSGRTRLIASSSGLSPASASQTSAKLFANLNIFVDVNERVDLEALAKFVNSATVTGDSEDNSNSNREGQNNRKEGPSEPGSSVSSQKLNAEYCQFFESFVVEKVKDEKEMQAIVERILTEISEEFDKYKTDGKDAPRENIKHVDICEAVAYYLSNVASAEFNLSKVVIPKIVSSTAIGVSVKNSEGGKTPAAMHFHVGPGVHQSHHKVDKEFMTKKIFPMLSTVIEIMIGKSSKRDVLIGNLPHIDNSGTEERKGDSLKRSRS